MKEYKIEILEDEFPESPDIWGDESLFLVYEHRQFCVKRKYFDPKSIFDHLEAKKWIEKHNPQTTNESLEAEGYYADLDDSYDNYFIFPVDAYIHSGVQLSLADTRDYPDRRWDVSTTGYILVEKDLVKSTENLDANKILDFSNHLETRAKEYAEGLVETWNQYLIGDIWGFKIVEIKKCECCGNTTENEVDSCWGFYGREQCEEEANLSLNSIKEHENKLKH